MAIEIRFATADDIPAMHGLIMDLAIYEKEPDAVTLTQEVMTKDFVNGLFQCIVAEVEGRVVGMALYYPRYSTWKGKTLHLEDFIVKEEHRQSGIGRMLFDRVVLESQMYGAKRLEWAVLEWNTPALNFYNKIGAHIDPEWQVAQLTEDQIQNFSFTSA
ncbi:MAG: GNAT family N-acetyltransferase [Schleiferiaceae bacterium]|jgi:GNAT superfamily N-acetyltransferase|nr:GNAT family N-acetyltransferase [Schleiferiaceae bacterium]